MNIRMDEVPFAGNAQGISKIYREVLLLMKFLQIKPQIRNMNITNYDLYYTVIKNRDENEILDDQYENIKNDHISFIDIAPNHYIGRKNDKDILR